MFPRAKVAWQVAAHLPTHGLTAQQVVARVEQLTDHALRLADAVPVGQPIRGVTPRRSDARYGTVQILEAEARILSLAQRGRAGGYGKVGYRVLWPAVETARLDGGQYRAVLQLAGNGDFLSVLTAPAGAGKTSTLGAASRAWAQAGYRVVGLAPSARAAAELATATGTRTDTLAKWLHNQDRLDRLPAAGGRAAAKVVLVGDPGQIGVINGPGGMLAALGHAGHGLELEQIHRFRAGLGTPRLPRLTQRRGRHPRSVPQGRPAAPVSGRGLDGVFTHGPRPEAKAWTLSCSPGPGSTSTLSTPEPAPPPSQTGRSQDPSSEQATATGKPATCSGPAATTEHCPSETGTSATVTATASSALVHKTS